MTNNQWGLLAMFLLMAGLFFYIKKVNKYSEEWFGENSFLKKPRSYEVKFSGLFDFDFLFASYLLIIGLLLIIKSTEFLYIGQYSVFLVLFFCSLLPFLISSFIFYKKWVFFNQNGDKIYRFDPIEKKITITKFDETVLSFADISNIDFYSLRGNRMSASFAIVNMLNGDRFVLTEEMKCYTFLSEFFVGVKQNRIEMDYSQLFKRLNWLRSNELNSMD